MLPELGVAVCFLVQQQACNTTTEAILKKKKKKGPFLQLMEMGMAERRTHSVMHRGSLQHRELTLHLLFRLEEIICHIEAEKDKKVVVK